MTTPTHTTPSATSVRSLDALKAKLKERSTPDLTTAPRFEHKGTGAVFLILPMSNEGYQDIEAVDVPDPKIANWAPADLQKLRDNQRTFRFLRHGCCLEDGSKLDDEAINELMKGPFGAENKALVYEIRKVNPPREVLIQEFRATIAATRMTLTLFRILKEAGALEKLRDWLLEDGESEKAEAITSDLRKWEDALLPFEAMMEADQAAAAFGIGVYERMRAEKAEKAAEPGAE